MLSSLALCLLLSLPHGPLDDPTTLPQSWHVPAAGVSLPLPPGFEPKVAEAREYARLGRQGGELRVLRKASGKGDVIETLELLADRARSAGAVDVLLLPWMLKDAAGKGLAGHALVTRSAPGKAVQLVAAAKSPDDKWLLIGAKLDELDTTAKILDLVREVRWDSAASGSKAPHALPLPGLRATLKVPDGWTAIAAGESAKLWSDKLGEVVPVQVERSFLRPRAAKAWFAELRRLAKEEVGLQYAAQLLEPLRASGEGLGYAELALSEDREDEARRIDFVARGPLCFRFQGMPKASERRLFWERATASTTPDPLAGAKNDGFYRESQPVADFTLPANWIAGEPANRMRMAQWTVDSEADLETVVSWLGPGSGGSNQANIERWVGSFAPGSRSTQRTVALEEGLVLTTLDITGVLRSAHSPADEEGAGLGEPVRALFAIVRIERGPLFVKTQGPIDAVAAIADQHRAWLESWVALR